MVDKQYRSYRYLPIILRLLAVLIVFIVISSFSTQGVEGDNITLRTTSFLSDVVELIMNGEIIANLWGSFFRVSIGYLFAVVLGVGFGAAMGQNRLLGDIFFPVIDAFRHIPPIAWIPVAIIWLGLGNRSAFFIVFIGAFFPIFIGTYDGIRSISAHTLRVAQNLGASRRLILAEILFPAALPRILSALRIGIGTAWACVIAAEMTGAQNGLGYAIQLSRIMLRTDRVLIYMIIIGLVGGLMNALLTAIEKRLTRWNETIVNEA